MGLSVFPKAFTLTICFAAVSLTPKQAVASDHLDAPTVVAQPAGDIGDLYGWISADGQRLNLVMTIIGKNLDPQIDYVFHIDSGKRFGATRETIELECRAKSAHEVDCALGTLDRAIGNANTEDGLRSRRGSFRVFAGLRDDPFYNNVRGTRDMYTAAMAVIKSGVTTDVPGCPVIDPAKSADLMSRWSRTDGEPGRNFLAGWLVSSLVVSVDIRSVAAGGDVLAIWSSTSGKSGRIDRAGRPLTGNSLLATLGPVELTNRMKEEYNRSNPDAAASFAYEISRGLALYDGFDGKCGNQWLASKMSSDAARYHQLSQLLADDRLWIDSRARRCLSLFAVERAALSGESKMKKDCGGRSLDIDAIDVYRSMLVNGSPNGVDDGVYHDDRPTSSDRFPFLAPPIATP